MPNKITSSCPPCSPISLLTRSSGKSFPRIGNLLKAAILSHYIQRNRKYLNQTLRKIYRSDKRLFSCQRDLCTKTLRQCSERGFLASSHHPRKIRSLNLVPDDLFRLSESQTIEDFGAALHLMRSDLEHLRAVFMAVENGDLGMLKSIGIKDSELGDVKFFLEKLVKTGFLD